MSITTLKRKTQAKYNNMSVGQPQFSLNGAYRNQGYVGQTMLSRSLPKTMIKSHGGANGAFPIQPVILSAVTSLNDHDVVKSTVLGSHGQLATKYRWITRPQPYTTVKPDSNNHVNNQHDYIMRRRKRALQVANSLYTSPKIVTRINPDISPSYGVPIPLCEYTKPESDFVAMTQGNYILRINENCTQNDVVFVPSPGNGGPILGR
uniref:Uncharacterized protein n=1 Tax=viral metagenome TaxID=1070528 RepID=A0A6C0I3X2_9ZZZZ